MVDDANYTYGEKQISRIFFECRLIPSRREMKYLTGLIETTGEMIGKDYNLIRNTDRHAKMKTKKTGTNFMRTIYDDCEDDTR